MDGPEATTPGEQPPQIDLREVPVDRLLEQVASELAMVAAAHLGLLPGTEGGGDAVSARQALDAGDALVAVLLAAPAPSPQATELRRSYAELKLAFAQTVGDADVSAEPSAAAPPPDPPRAAPPPPPPPPPRPRIWTPGGEV